MSHCSKEREADLKRAMDVDLGLVAASTLTGVGSAAILNVPLAFSSLVIGATATYDLYGKYQESMECLHGLPQEAKGKEISERMKKSPAK